MNTIRMFPINLLRGDRVVMKKSSAGVVTKSLLVERIEIAPRGCRNGVHVNGDQCFDNVAMVEVLNANS